MGDPVSFMSPIGYQYNTCGYCKSKPKRTSPNYYAQSPRAVHPVHYEGLINRGWRRAGTLFYKPNPQRACCPHYTIRLDASSFKPTKGQRKAVNRWNRYILGVDYQYKVARLCPRTREEKKRRQTIFDLQNSVHEAEYAKLKLPKDPKTGRIAEPAHKLEINLEPDSLTEEKYALYKHYQTKVHKENPNQATRGGFRGFLCAGMAQSVYNADGRPRKIGSFHQCYRVDGRLVAVAVLDLLPYAVSSVYFIYHTDFSDHAMGRLSALLEISMALEDGYRYYYMGYYIHSCPKMRYKREFKPTYVLDAYTYNWDLMDQPMLEGMSIHKHFTASREGSRAAVSPEAEDPRKPDGKPNPPTKAHLSVFADGMPGIVKADCLPHVFDLSKVLCSTDAKEIIAPFSPGSTWEATSIENPSSLQGSMAELLACVGPEVAKEVAMISSNASLMEDLRDGLKSANVD